MDPTAHLHTGPAISGNPFMTYGKKKIPFALMSGIHFNFAFRELQAIENGDADAVAGPNSLDKERSLVNDDPKWLDTTYVLANYKTEPCKKPPRLCRQGYACPQFHNNKDKRRSPKKYKYRLEKTKSF